MHANNETGAINDIASIGAAAHRHNVPFHCDTVQMFGKHPLDPVRCGVDSFCISFHKLQGPPGVGALVIKQELISGWRVHPYIFGSQNAGLRGGTENLPGIGAAFAATKLTFIGRKEKNEQLLALKRYIVNELNMRMPARSYTQYLASSRGRVSTPEVELVFLCGANPAEYLPNTILLSVVKHTEPFICNSKLKQALEASGVVVSIGSACNTDSPKASHVLYAMGCDDLIRKGTLRITLGDQTTAAEAKQFVQTFLLTVKEAIGQ
jgi:cysteine desulfurase